MLRFSLTLFLVACSADVDYSGTEYQCQDGVTCPEGSDCVDGRCLIDPGPRPMVAIPESTFTMGCEPDGAIECEEDAASPHLVTLSAFDIDSTEVTQLDYWRCVSDGACSAPASFNPGDEPDLPVVLVSWQAALDFCAWTGKRLPTEAEWELVARGEAGATYPWGEDAPDCGLAHFSDCAPAARVPVSQPGGDTTPLGVRGMAGNVSEWVVDWYDPEYYAASPALDPGGPASGLERVVRGAAFNDGVDELPGWRREGDTPTEADDDTGIRCARSAAQRQR
jgi:formylglycine-generating enzyme required for sulfatase activity